MAVGQMGKKPFGVSHGHLVRGRKGFLRKRIAFHIDLSGGLGAEDAWEERSRCFRSRKMAQIVRRSLRPKSLSGLAADCQQDSAAGRSTPEGIRTPNPRFRRPMLYPIELRAHTGQHTPNWVPHNLALHKYQLTKGRTMSRSFAGTRRNVSWLFPGRRSWTIAAVVLLVSWYGWRVLRHKRSFLRFASRWDRTGTRTSGIRSSIRTRRCTVRWGVFASGTWPPAS
jgi:hypothetical protein